MRGGHRRATRLATAASLGALVLGLANPARAEVAPEPLPKLDLAAYAGTWYQVAWFPNRFQRQCVSDTQARYRLLPGGDVEVENRCRRADGGVDSVVGLARPRDASVRNGELRPASLEVTFVPSLLRWLPFVWAPYWVIQQPEDGRYAVVSEPSREYLWVLARAPLLAPADETAIRSRLQQQGFDLSRWQAHPHAEPPR